MVKIVHGELSDYYVVKSNRGEFCDAWAERAAKELGGEIDRFWKSCFVYALSLKDGRIVFSA